MDDLKDGVSSHDTVGDMEETDALTTFTEGVWRKVRYLEYAKHEQEQVEANRRSQLRARLHSGILLSGVTALFAVPLFCFFGLSPGTISAAGIVTLGAGVMFEYLADLKSWRIGNAYKHK